MKKVFIFLALVIFLAGCTNSIVNNKVDDGAIPQVSGVTEREGTDHISEKDAEAMTEAIRKANEEFEREGTDNISEEDAAAMTDAIREADKHCNFEFATNWASSEDFNSNYTFKYPEIGAKYIIASGYSEVSRVGWPPKIVINDDIKMFPCAQDIKYTLAIDEDGTAQANYKMYTVDALVDSKDITMTFTLGFPNCEKYDIAYTAECHAQQDSVDIDQLITQILSTLKKK